MSVKWELGVVPESERAAEPVTAFDRKIRALAEAAMSVTHHDCSSDFDVEWHHEVSIMETKFRKILGRGKRIRKGTK